MQPTREVHLSPIEVAGSAARVERLLRAETMTVPDDSSAFLLRGDLVEEAAGGMVGVDLARRGPFGVQADLSLLGSSFQQVAVAVDGVVLNDPQTAHHNMNIPLGLGATSRLEVLRGVASSSYGSGAFGGVLNLVTRDPSRKRLESGLSVGMHELVESHTVVEIPGREGGLLLEAAASSSGGYRYGTDFDRRYVFVKGKRGVHSLSVGWLDKAFGAFDFYTPGANLPSFERTKTLLGVYAAEGKKGRTAFGCRTFLRYNKDDFVLDRSDPTWYRNVHTTRIYGIKGNVAHRFGLQWEGESGLEVRREEISGALGGYHRRAVSVSGSLDWRLPMGMEVLPRLRVDDYSSLDAEVSSSLDVSWYVSDSLSLYAAYADGFRVPSFTEMYYSSPYNKGNPSLRAEKAKDGRLGCRYRIADTVFTVEVFRRDQDDMIDWVKSSSSDPDWEAMNLASARVEGGLVALETKLHGRYSFSVSYVHLRSRITVPDGYLSKYATHHPEDDLKVHLVLPLGDEVQLYMSGRACNRKDADSYVLLNTRAVWRSFFIAVDNLLDERYEDVGGVEQPGLWLYAGFDLEL